MSNTKVKLLINHFLIGGIIFTIPSNLFYVVNDRIAYVHGLRLDYLLPKIYLSDLLIGLFFAWLFFSQQFKIPLLRPLNWLTKHRLLAVVSGLFLLRQFFSPYPVAAIWQVGKLTILFIFFWTLNLVWPKLKTTWLSFALSLTIIFQALLGALQFFNQQSIARYWLLGEPNLLQPLGLAQQVIFGQQRTLAYGTTAHPNVLAGVTVILLISAWLINEPTPKKPVWNRLTLYLASFLTLVTIYITQSWTAFLVLLVALTWKVFLQQLPKKSLVAIVLTTWVITPLILNFFGLTATNPSWRRRAYLNQAAWRLFSARPVTGVGIGNFVGRVEEFSLSREVVRFIQPAHHVPILISAEIGWLGLVWLWLILQSFSPANSWSKAMIVWALILFPVMTLDHYLWTLQTGLLLSGIFYLTVKKFLNQPQK